MIVATHRWHFVATDDYRKQLTGLSKKDTRLIFQRMKELLEANNPKSVTGTRKLVSVDPPQYRLRQGVYRIIFAIDTQPVTVEKHGYQGTVEFLAVLHRKDAYRP